MDINYNKWKEEKTDIKWQLMFEAEKELLKPEHIGNNIISYSIGEQTVAGINDNFEVRLRLHPETKPSLIISRKGFGFVGQVFLKDVDLDYNPQYKEQIKEIRKMMRQSYDGDFNELWNNLVEIMTVE